ncbi:hypothetical protein VTK26DRAFT_433 [Humicola hyalothermophila]
MSILNQKSKFKVKTEVRKVKQAVESTPQQRKSSLPPASARASPFPPTSSSFSSSLKKTNRHLPSTSPETDLTSSQKSLKRRAAAARIRNSPAANASPSFSDDSEPGSGDDDDDWRDRFDPNRRQRLKRARTAETEDPARRLRHPDLWVGGPKESADGGGKGEENGIGEEEEKLVITHAVEVASLADGKCQPVLGLGRDEVAVRLRYPGANYLERYELVWGRDKIDAAVDIMKVVTHVASIYLDEDQARPFLDQNNGIYRRLEKSKNTKDGNGFKAALEEYNEQLFALQKKGAIARNIDNMRSVPRELVEFILDQVYDRTVAPKVELLAKYENGTDNVYGELLHPFISDIFDRTKLTSEMVFVDLGSGVGNVVLQAALERGCESWGCEMMENACNLADAQNREFAGRCRLWGIAPGKVHLERGDFRKSEKTMAALKRADVVLVNNQAFTSQLNDHLVNMFLDLKIGCKIVSLKTFVHDNKIAENDVASSILNVEHLTYPEGYVSWTGASGTYCISTRK